MATGEGGGRDRNPSWGEVGTQRVQGGFPSYVYINKLDFNYSNGEYRLLTLLSLVLLNVLQINLLHIA